MSTHNAKVTLKGRLQPSRVYRAAEEQWYRVDHSLFGRVYLWLTGNFRYIKEVK